VTFRLKELGITSDEWLSLPSSLRDEFLGMPEGQVPEEYRELVQRYVRTLARRGTQPNGEQKP
jgi:hypothetical protein